MVSGNPYISVKSATRNAEKALNERQSRFDWGLAKLNANMMNTAELMSTSDQRPYPTVSGFTSNRLAGVAIAVAVSVTAMH